MIGARTLGPTPLELLRREKSAYIKGSVRFDMLL
jgi:hypothetical protein